MATFTENAFEDVSLENYFALETILPSLQEYLLISSTKVLVEHHVKQANNRWELTIYRNKEDRIIIRSINFTTEVRVFYENVIFGQ